MEIRTSPFSANKNSRLIFRHYIIATLLIDSNCTRLRCRIIINNDSAMFQRIMATFTVNNNEIVTLLFEELVKSRAMLVELKRVDLVLY